MTITMTINAMGNGDYIDFETIKMVMGVATLKLKLGFVPFLIFYHDTNYTFIFSYDKHFFLGGN